MTTFDYCLDYILKMDHDENVEGYYTTLDFISSKLIQKQVAYYILDFLYENKNHLHVRVVNFRDILNSFYDRNNKKEFILYGETLRKNSIFKELHSFVLSNKTNFEFLVDFIFYALYDLEERKKFILGLLYLTQPNSPIKVLYL